MMDIPPAPARVPHRNRHYIHRVRIATRRRAATTVAEPWVDMAADITAINRGEGVRRGDTWTVHARSYRVERDGHSYPLAGPGLHTLDRRAFLALAIYNERGLTPAAERQLDYEDIDAESRRVAQRLWRRGRGA